MIQTRSRRIVEASIRRPQGTVIGCEKRFRVLVAGRRFGKTQVALFELLRAVCAKGRTAWYVAPSYRQAKQIAWKRLKEMAKPFRPARVHESDLRIEFPWNATIALRGADHYDSLRGGGLDLVVLDEYASMAPEAWTEVLRPSLADRRGRALFVGTPRGHNHFYELFEAAQSLSDWATFRFTTKEGGNVSREELETAARELDERTYLQEFEASFENLNAGRVYYAFEAQVNIESLACYQNYPLFWSMDFNVNPMCSVIGQVVEGTVHVLDEIVLQDSHTLAACQAFLEWVQARRLSYPVQLSIYGDASGDSRHTSASETDWQIVREFMDRHSADFRASLSVCKTNPAVKDRTNCVNALLKNHYGQYRLRIDPKCRQLIRDLEQVRWKTDAYGNSLMELDKSDPKRTHVSDALGYMIATKFPMYPAGGYRREYIA
jgi:hypothetical protein